MSIKKQRKNNELFFAVLYHLEVLHYFRLVAHKKAEAARYAEYALLERASWTTRSLETDDQATTASVHDGMKLLESEPFQLFYKQLIEGLGAALDITYQEVLAQIDVMAECNEIHEDSVAPLKQIVTQVHNEGAESLLGNMHSVLAALPTSQEPAVASSSAVQTSEILSEIDPVYHSSMKESYRRFEQRQAKGLAPELLEALLEITATMSFLKAATMQLVPEQRSNERFVRDVVLTSSIFSTRMSANANQILVESFSSSLQNTSDGQSYFLSQFWAQKYSPCLLRPRALGQQPLDNTLQIHRIRS